MLLRSSEDGPLEPDPEGAVRDARRALALHEHGCAEGDRLHCVQAANLLDSTFDGFDRDVPGAQKLLRRTCDLGDESSCKRVLAPLDEVVHVTGGKSRGCAVKRDGSVWCWQGQDRVTPIAGVAGAKRIDCSRRGACCALTEARAIFCWTGDDPTPKQKPQPTGGVAFSRGDDHACVLADRGDVRCAGSNQFHALGVTDPTAKESELLLQARDLVATGTGSCALVADGERCWGVVAGTTYPEPSAIFERRDAAQVSLGTAGVCVRYADGKATCQTRGPRDQLDTVELDGVVNVAGDGESGCVLRSDGVSCWSIGRDEQLVFATRPEHIRELTVSGNEGCAVTDDGAPWCWTVGIEAASPLHFRYVGLPR